MIAADDTIDRVVEIERLAALDPIVYEVTRAEAAKRLGMRAHVLDRAVRKKRRELGLETDNEDDGQGRAVKIVDVLPWHELVDGDMIATTLAAAVKTYAVLPDAAADAIALWTLHTWLVNSFMISPRLAVVSPTKGCGKTTVLRVLHKIVRRPKRAGSISPPALFRAVAKFQPTILLDETEKFIEHGSDLHGLLCEGHAQGGNVMRVLGENLELREFAVFSAVAYARNGKLPDDLEQRSIVIEMQRRRADETVTDLRDDRCEPLHRVARMCARWSEDVLGTIEDYDPDMGGLINRVADNWRPLFAIADLIGVDWPERVREAAVILAPRESESVGPMPLADIKAIFADKETDRLSSAEICNALAAMETRSWGEWKTSKSASPKPISQNQLARLLKDFHIGPDNIYPGDGSSKRPKGYRRAQFEEAWERYLAAEGATEPLNRYNADEMGTSHAFRTATSESEVADQKCEKPLRPNDCSGVAVQKGGNGLSGADAEPWPRVCEHCGTPERPSKRVQTYEFDGERFLLHPDCHGDWLAAPDPNEWSFNLNDGP
jgi:putative DNA primase/helicase